MVASKFEELGLRPQTGLALTGVKGRLEGGKPGPTLALLGELDSQPLPAPSTSSGQACREGEVRVHILPPSQLSPVKGGGLVTPPIPAFSGERAPLLFAPSVIIKPCNSRIRRAHAIISDTAVIPRFCAM